MNSQEVLAAAGGRTIVVGEEHERRSCLHAATKLMRAAHKNGYRIHGVELPHESRFRHVGLDEMCALVRCRGKRHLCKHDSDGYIRENKYWHIQQAQALGWDVVSLDPYHYDYLKERYFIRRDPAICRAIVTYGPMIAVVGAFHLVGIDRILGSSVYCVTTVRYTRDDYAEFYTPDHKRIRFSNQTPLLA